MSEILSINNVHGYLDKETGTAYLNAEDVARGFGFVHKQTMNGTTYTHIRWSTVNNYLAEFGFCQRVGKNDFLPENMVYRLGFKASNEAAQKFQAVLADDVLPAIRKTGGYIAGSENMTEAEIMARAVLIGQRTIEEQQKRILELKPKADYTDKILASADLVTTTAIAKDYGMSAQQLNNLLKGLKILFKRSGQWFLYAKYQNAGYTSSDTISFTHKNGEPGSVMHTKWTQKGRKFLYEKLKETGILPMIERQGN